MSLAAPSPFIHLAIFSWVGFIAMVAMGGAPRRSHPTVELLTFSGCPNSSKMKAHLETAMKSLHLTQNVKVVDITKLAATDWRRGYGSPTVLFNRRDLFGRGKPAEASISCRIYSGGVPTTIEIEKHLHRLTKR